MEDRRRKPQFDAAAREVTGRFFPSHDVRIAEDHGQLTYQLEGQPSVKMTSLGAGAFLVPRSKRIVFDIVNGRATGFVTGDEEGRPLEAVRRP